MTSLNESPTRLEISLVAAAGPTDCAGRGFGFLSGGPAQLLAWLEERLGLGCVDERWWRVELFARGIGAALEGDRTATSFTAYKPLELIEKSFVIDRFGAAEKLLQLRDSLLLACPLSGSPNLDEWPESNYSQLPKLAAAAVAASKAVAAYLSADDQFLLRRGVADRLRAVADALDVGQILPDYEIILSEPLDSWPRRWQDLLAKLQKMPAPPHESADGQSVAVLPPPDRPVSADGTVLAAWQSLLNPCGDALLPAASGSLAGAVTAGDSSLAAVRCSSMYAACTAVASALAVEYADRIKPADGSPGLASEMAKPLGNRREMPWLDDVMIVCGDDDTAICLDGELARLELPTCGAAASRITSDILAILPLAIAARYTPANADRVRELLCLAVPPVDISLARELVRELRTLPAVGSPKWDAAVNAHPRVEHRLALAQWLPRPQQAASGGLATPSCGPDGRETLSVAEIREVLDLVENYALDHRTFDNQGGDSAVQSQFRILATRARAIGRILSPRPSDARLDRAEIDALINHVSEPYSARVFGEQAGSPFRVRSLAAIRYWQDDAPINIRHVIWLGVRSERVASSHWSSNEIDQLHAAGLPVQRPVDNTLVARHAEQRGIMRIKESLTVVDFPAADNSRHAHPLWTLLCDCLTPSGADSAIVDLDVALATATEVTPYIAVGRWMVPLAWTTPEPAPSPQPEWIIPEDIPISPRKQTSWTETDKRVGCPLAWMLERHAGFWPGRRADPPNAFALLGTVAEQIIRVEASTWLDRPPADKDEAAQRMLSATERMLPFLWSDVALRPKSNERRMLDEAVGGTARELLQYASVCDGFGTSLRVFGPSIAMRGGHTFTGEIDWAPTTSLLVIDFKWGRSKYENLFQHDNFGQLAIYAWNRLVREQAAGRWSGKSVDDAVILYLSIRDASWISKFDDCLSTQTVVDAFESMLILADKLFGTHRRVFAWPLLPPTYRLQSEPAATALATDLNDWQTHLPRQSGAASRPEQSWHICEYCKLDRICGKRSVR